MATITSSSSLDIIVADTGMSPLFTRLRVLLTTAVAAILLYGAYDFAHKNINKAVAPRAEDMHADFVRSMAVRFDRQASKEPSEGLWASERMPNGLMRTPPDMPADVGDDRRILTLHRLNDTAATCLDGTQGAFYYRKGHAGIGRRHHLIYLQGGAWCTSEKSTPRPGGESCTDRAKGMMGSTSGDWPTARLGSDWDPLFASSLRDYSLAFVRYCDGASFSGTAGEGAAGAGDGSAPRSRGDVIVRAVVQQLFESHGLDKADTVVLAGGSAGALGALLQVDRVADQLERMGSRAKVLALADSGVFLHHESPNFFGKEHPHDYVASMRFVHAHHRVAVPEACAVENAGDDEYRCLFAEHLIPHIRSPIFLLQSVFDAWMLGNVLSPADSTHVPRVNAFGDAVETAMAKALSSKKGGAAGAFVDRCRHHCFSWRGVEATQGDGAPATQLQAFESFMTAARSGDASGGVQKPMVWRQSGAYPCMKCCPPGLFVPGAGGATSLWNTIDPVSRKWIKYGSIGLLIWCFLAHAIKYLRTRRRPRVTGGHSHSHDHSRGG